jgi:hypothetical protein
MRWPYLLVAFATVVPLVGSVASPAAPALALPPEVADAAAAPLAAVAHAADLATRITSGGGLEAPLLLLADEAGLARVPPPAVPAYPNMVAAVAALAQAGGRPLSADDTQRVATTQDRIGPALSSAIANLASAMVAALDLREQALVGVPAADLHMLQDAAERIAMQGPAAFQELAAAQPMTSALSPVSSGFSMDLLLARLGIDPASYHAATAKVDMGRMATAAAVTLHAIDAALPILREHASDADLLGAQGVAGPLAPAPAGACGGLPPATLVASGVLLLGTAAAESFGTGTGRDVLLSIDLGGNDAYCNNAGSTQASGGDPLTGPSPCAPALLSAVLVDVAGDDDYHSRFDDASATSRECFMGSTSHPAVAVLVDASGDDAYNSHKVLATPAGACPAAATGTGGAVSLTVWGSEGAAFGSGVGILADLGGSDAYDSDNQLCHAPASGPAATNLVFYNAQGDGIEDGIGLVLDATERSVVVNGFPNPGFSVAVSPRTNLWASSNRQTSPTGVVGTHTMFSAETEGGAEEEGLGAIVSLDANDRYFSDNVQSAPGGGALIWFLGDTQGTSEQIFDIEKENGETGLMVDAIGDDSYACGNRQDHGDSTTGSALMTVSFHQGASNAYRGGALIDLDGTDCYDSQNHQTADTTDMNFELGEGYGGNGIGVLADLGLGDNAFASANTQTGGTGTFGAGGWTTHLGAVFMQGATGPDARMPLPKRTQPSIGALAVGLSPNVKDPAFSLLKAGGADTYISYNVQSSASGLDGAEFIDSQAAAVAPLSAALLLDEDSGEQDAYASNNLGGSGSGIHILGMQGASGGPFAPLGTAPGSGTSVFVDVGGSNLYDVGNTHAPFAGLGGCNPYPTYALSCTDWANGASSGPEPAFFVDLSVEPRSIVSGTFAPDSYPAWPLIDSLALGMYGAGGFGFCIDAYDGLEVPPGTCIDR